LEEGVIASLFFWSIDLVSSFPLIADESLAGILDCERMFNAAFYSILATLWEPPALTFGGLP